MLVAVETSDGDGDEEEGVGGGGGGGGGALEDQDQQPEERAAKGLSRDVGVVMRIRAERGYGLHDVSFWRKDAREEEREERIVRADFILSISIRWFVFSNSRWRGIQS